ncbi:MAG: L,D-transpeptidase family protein, partial [Pseudomonadota bacterium]
QTKSTGNVVAYLRLLAPHTPRYERLRLAMAAYKNLAASGGWETLEAGETLKPGMEDERVPALKKRLAASGDYVGDINNPSIMYDGDIVDAVMAFQKRHGLEIDGVIGPNTLKELNVSVEDRIAMMEYNLERRRWMQDDYGQYYVFANLADQVLKVVRDGKTVHAELIQVGLPYHRTPVFTDEMEYIEINPYWNVPKSIAVNELLPKLRRNANALGSQNFEVLAGGRVIPASGVPWGSYSKANFPVRLRQRPGTKNALGRIKFMFPNNFNVYIHDTPSKSKFEKASRFFSHGCLRLKDPLKMAEVILGEQGWSREKIDATVASKKRKVVKLENNIPVHIAYMTAWVNKDGSIHFRRDVYGRDKILGKALQKVRS